MRRLYYFVARLNQNGSSKVGFENIILGVDYDVTLWPEELDVDSIYEFDSSAARWLGLAGF